jgi:hypothetical protein
VPLFGIAAASQLAILKANGFQEKQKKQLVSKISVRFSSVSSGADRLELIQRSACSSRKRDFS